MDNINHKSGIIKKEFLLLEPFIKEPLKRYTLADIKKITNNKSQHYVYDALNKFSSKGILAFEIVGKSKAYYLDYNNPSIINYLTFFEFIKKENRKDIPFNILNDIIKDVNSPFVLSLITGSYAVGEQKKNSDIDLILIIPDSEDKKKYEIALKEGDLVHPAIHGFVFKLREFYNMLVNKEFNLGKEAVKKHIILSGAEDYYKILFEAIKNGFTY